MPFDHLLEAAKEQGFKVRYLADGHITFTSPEGKLTKTRRTGLDRKGGHGHAWGDLLRQLKSVGFAWPVPSAPVEIRTMPSLIHAKAEPMLVTPVKVAEDSVRVYYESGMPVKEEKVVVAAKPKLVPVKTGRTDNAPASDVAALTRRLREFATDNFERDGVLLADMAGCSLSLLQQIKSGRIGYNNNLTQAMTSEVNSAMDRWSEGARLPRPELAGLTPKQRIMYRYVAANGAIAALDADRYFGGQGSRSMLNALVGMGKIVRVATGVIGPGGQGITKYQLVNVTPEVKPSPALGVDPPTDSDDPDRPLAPSPSLSAPTPDWGEKSNRFPDLPPPPVPARPRPRELSPAGQSFGELFDQELAEGIKAETARLEETLKEKEKQIASLYGKNAELRAMVTEAEKRATLTEAQRSAIKDFAMEAAQRAVEAALQGKG